jgi:DnaJ family protein C protein 28
MANPTDPNRDPGPPRREGEGADPGTANRARAREMGVDAAIQEAMARGDFDNLSGKGRPLVWDTERDDDRWLADHLLKNAGYRPDWLERAEAIDAERLAIANLLADHVAWHRAHAAAEPEAALRHAADAVARRYRERAERLNREVERHNLAAPHEALQRRKAPLQRELDAFYRRLGLPRPEPGAPAGA